MKGLIHSTNMYLHIILDRNMNPKTACLGKRRNPEEIGKYNKIYERFRGSIMEIPFSLNDMSFKAYLRMLTTDL